MTLNQLYHDHGVAQTRAQHASTAVLRAEHAAEARRVDHRIRTNGAGMASVVAPSADKFEIYRAEEVQVTSTQFVGGDWRWRLTDVDNRTLVEGGGYRSERACRVAVSLLRDRARLAS
ncbi:hypothetical protein ACWPM1_02560 [Tsuneonella sp. HG249]